MKMPPVQHSSSSKSAHKDSDQISADQNYPLGDYSFRIERTSVPGSTNDKIEAICTKDGKNARKSIQIDSNAKLNGYYVETNETEATVYAIVSVPISYEEEKEYEGQDVIYCGPTAAFMRFGRQIENERFFSEIHGSSEIYAVAWASSDSPHGIGIMFYSLSPFSGTEVRILRENGEERRSEYIRNSQSFHDSDIGYYYSYTLASFNDTMYENLSYAPALSIIDFPRYTVEEILFLGTAKPKDFETKEILVGRFAIDIEDAGGVGPDAEGGDGPDDDWDDPDDYYDDDYDDYEDTEEYDDELYLELDRWDGEPGESFTVTITGHNGESVVVSVQPNDITEEILTYRLYAPASKDMPLTYTFVTDESWMGDGIYSRAFLVTATTDETARTANDGFTLYVEEPDMLTVDTDMDEGQPGETITAYVGGHSGHTFSAVVTNAVGDIVATFSQVVPQSQYSDVELPIVLNEAWFSSNSSSETLIITATTDDNRQASVVFKMVLEPLTVSLDVDKYTAEVGEEVTWSMEAEGGNGNYQYNFFIFLDGELVRDGRWQFDNFLTYTPHSPGIYTVEGYAKDSRLSQNVKAPEDGEVVVEGEPEPEPEPEPDEITRTLYVTVTGALSGRHNDPGKDPSYSYLPAEKSTIADYGCGGDGGHGGGGGAGASNVVVYKFATDKADSKEITAITKRPGFGSGGGKGGKGGDGCILVYY